MQTVPTISQNLWNALAQQSQRLNVLVEIYPNDTLPTGDGFDPADATLRIADTTTTFLGRAYARYIHDVGTVSRTITKQFNSVSLTLDNSDRSMAAFVLNQAAPIEGMFIVVRVVSGEFTATILADSFVAFTGKLEKPFDGGNQTIKLSARQYIGSNEEEIPWRTFSPEDEQGIAATDPLFEGFLFSAKPGTITYKERVRRGGFAGILGLKKTVTRTLQFSNHQGVEVERAVPLILGRAQVQFQPVAYIDAGTQINAIYAVGEGALKKFFDLRVITAGYQFASIADNNPEVDQFRFGYPGNTNGQVPFLDNLTGGIPGNGYYSNTAMMSTAFYGTEVSQDDPAPEVIAVMLGLLIPLPDESMDFSLTDWSDNPAYHVRWLLTHDRTFNLNEAFINDLQCIKTACYCDDPVLDQTDGERILLQNSEAANYGVTFRRYHSTGLFTPEYFLHYFLGVGQDPLPELTLPTAEFYDSSAGAPLLTPQTRVRRRFTSNIYLTERMKSSDFLFDVLLTTFRGYLVQNAKGKIDIKCKRPADNTIIRSEAEAGDTEVAVNTILPWVASLDGSVIVGNDLLTSEVREVIGTRYSAVANDITLVVAGNLTRSGATLTGGDDDNPATGTVTVTGMGTLTVTIDGHAVSYTTQAADTTGSAAGMLAQFLKADPTFQTYLKFTWDKDVPTVINIQSKLGFLELDSELDHDHDITEEVLRIQMAFSDTGADHANLAAANILEQSIGWPLGGRQSSKNRIDGKFIDSPQGFAVQALRTRDATHIAQTGKVLPQEVTLTGVDSFSQAKRLQNGILAELRDLDFFMQHTADRRALLLEEGDLICNTHASGGFRNVALRVEDVKLNLSRMTIDIIARRYSTSAYSDVAAARNVPLPTSLNTDNGPPAIAFNTTDFAPNGLSQTTDTEGITTIRGGAIFGASVFGQIAHVRVNRPSDGAGVFNEVATITPGTDNKAIFEFLATEVGVYTVQLEVCFTTGSAQCNTTKPEATITIALGGLLSLLAEDTGFLITEDELANISLEY